MRVLVFEFVCGGGCFSFPNFGQPSGSLLDEGQQMLGALLDQLLPESDLLVTAPIDVRCSPNLPFHQKFSFPEVDSHQRLCEVLLKEGTRSDVVLLIAPEIDQALLHFTGFLEPLKATLNAPNQKVVRLGSDKLRTANFLSKAGISTPGTHLISDLELAENRKSDLISDKEKRYVLKPRWGAGSWGVETCRCNGEEIGDLFDHAQEYCKGLGLKAENALIQPQVEGVAASIAVWCDVGNRLIFPATSQNLEAETYRYLGCDLPLEEPFQSRARQLLDRVLAALPEFQGYVGLDLILDNDPNTESPQDWVIEINPRLTTSFCQTRKWIDPALMNSFLLGKNVPTK